MVEKRPAWVASIWKFCQKQMGVFWNDALIGIYDASWKLDVCFWTQKNFVRFWKQDGNGFPVDSGSIKY